MPCYFYKVVIDKWRVENNRGSWSHYRTDSRGVKFYLEDGSGKVLIDPTTAEFDLEYLCQREVGEDWTRSTQPLVQPWRSFGLL